MLRTRQQLEAAEARSLAPYAQAVTASAGRTHPEAPHAFRTDFQRDRARIIHSRAFRRLDGKTQVFLNGRGDHFRTRLTHTMEVASISRAIARPLGANEDLAEAIALAHDLGHAPFGHAGEETLNRLLSGHGGFEHNTQSLRIVELIESKYVRFPGLNLTYEVLEGLRKHDRGFTRPSASGRPEETFPSPSLEAQIANLADEIAYSSHDLDDALDSGLVREEQLAGLEIWDRCVADVRTQFPDLAGEALVRHVIRSLTDFQVEALVAATHQRLEALAVASADAVRRHPASLAGHSQEMRMLNQQLRKFLFQNFYLHPDIAGPTRHACAAMEVVFHRYLARPELLGPNALRRVSQHGLHRTVADYISGMTDGYLLSEAAKF